LLTHHGTPPHVTIVPEFLFIKPIPEQVSLDRSSFSLLNDAPHLTRPYVNQFDVLDNNLDHMLEILLVLDI